MQCFVMPVLIRCVFITTQQLGPHEDRSYERRYHEVARQKITFAWLQHHIVLSDKERHLSDALPRELTRGWIAPRRVRCVHSAQRVKDFGGQRSDLVQLDCALRWSQNHIANVLNYNFYADDGSLTLDRKLHQTVRQIRATAIMTLLHKQRIRPPAGDGKRNRLRQF
jgi:hypothetical protein